MTQAAPVSPAMPMSSVTIALVVVMWLAWVAVVVVADFLAVMMFAFADSPGAAKAAGLMIVPVFAWLAFTFIAGVALLIFRGWWQIPLAFVLALSPPMMVLIGYNLLMGVNVSTSTVPSPPAPRIAIPPGGFVPDFTPPKQPDWRATTRAADQP